MKKRHAILLCGFLRNYEEYIESFKKNNRNRDDVDLFICFWDQINAHPKPTKLHKEYEDLNFVNEQKLKDEYNPTVMKIFCWSDYYDLIKPMCELIQVSGLVGPGGLYNAKSNKTVERTVGASFLVKEAFKQLEIYQQKNNIKYVNVLRTRTEFGQYDVGGYYPKIDWDRDYSDAIYIPNWNFISRGGMKPISSVGALSSFENMKIYCDLMLDLPKIATKFNNQPGKCWGDEYCYGLHLTQNNIDWKRLK